jgi:sulfoxide reductase heme-binding subunit YedZ
VALDLIAALILTSLARAHISRRAWRGIHWLAYAAWPVALVHGYGSSPDMRSGGLWLLTIGCTLAVGAVSLWRLAGTAREVPRAERAAAALASVRRSARPTRRDDPGQAAPPGSGRMAHQVRVGNGGAR